MQSRNLQKSLLIGLMTLTLLLIAGTGLSTPAQAGDTIVITTTPTSGVTLFDDDFATYSGRWSLSESAKATVSYDDGAFSLRVVSPGVYTWSVPDFDTPLRNYRLAAAATLHGGSADSLFGFVIDYQDDEHFYALLTTIGGQWQLLRRQDGEWLDLTPADVKPVERADDGSIVALRADVVGDTVTLYIDDQEAGRVALDEDLTGAVFGLIARAGRGYVEVSFDDFKVTAED